MIEERVKKDKYTYEEVLSDSLSYFNGDELAATTWINKYAVKNSNGEFLESTPDQMHQRMAKEFGRIESKYNEKETSIKNFSTYGKKRKPLTEKAVYNLFKDFKYVIPQGSVMFGLGNNQIVASLSNCIVVPPVYDSYGGIFHTDQQMAQLFKR
ncbi:MAG: ribonucleoside-diphosphate reductase, adenosylcobalamin-dependent, partial [Flavobacteriaceae bacterium]|nr:ribonucleoside-diphosphate reductase, adenosylcobalamin-dependent [Flavobacteriaceae bacterium]